MKLIQEFALKSDNCIINKKPQDSPNASCGKKGIDFEGGGKQEVGVRDLLKLVRLLIGGFAW
jgi:hypothetical protein